VKLRIVYPGDPVSKVVPKAPGVGCGLIWHTYGNEMNSDILAALEKKAKGVSLYANTET